MTLDAGVRQSDTPSCKDLLSRISADPSCSWLNCYFTLQTEAKRRSASRNLGQPAPGVSPEMREEKPAGSQQTNTAKRAVAPVTRVR